MEHHYHAGRHILKLIDKGEACYPPTPVLKTSTVGSTHDICRRTTVTLNINYLQCSYIFITYISFTVFYSQTQEVVRKAQKHSTTAQNPGLNDGMQK